MSVIAKRKTRPRPLPYAAAPPKKARTPPKKLAIKRANDMLGTQLADAFERGVTAEREATTAHLLASARALRNSFGVWPESFANFGCDILTEEAGAIELGQHREELSAPCLFGAAIRGIEPSGDANVIKSVVADLRRRTAAFSPGFPEVANVLEALANNYESQGVPPLPEDDAP